MSYWAADPVFYHIYPLGCLGAPERNTFDGAPADRLSGLHAWIDYLVELGIEAIYLGPVFESSAHGYDTADYFKVDRRLGDNSNLATLSRKLHSRGIRLVLDGVFHHTGRAFWAFRDVLARGYTSSYCDWYELDFTQRSPYGDPFHYKGWAGHYDLVKLNLRNPAVREHLFAAVTAWVEQFEIDGLRLDAADRLDFDFQRDLTAHCRRLRADFWLAGEVVHGDYRRWCHPGGLSSTTNYELYKGLWSSHNDRNYFEIAYSLNRQFGSKGIYRGLDLYTFADNHDVERAASILKEPGHLYPLYILLMTVPGIPSIYYGSEWGIEGRKLPRSDAPLRPALTPSTMPERARHGDLYKVIKQLIGLRRRYSALRRGDYGPLYVAREQFAFRRTNEDMTVVVAVNAADRQMQFPLHLSEPSGSRLVDVLNGEEIFQLADGRCTLHVHSRWGRVLVLR